MAELTSADLWKMMLKAGLVDKKGNLVPAEAANLVNLAVNPDWDPKDHPKDHLGKFVKKGHGVYLFGKTKTATFELAEAHAGSLSVTAEPGQSVHLVTGTTGKHYVVTKNVDGTMDATAYSQSGEKLANVNLNPNTPIAKAVANGKATSNTGSKLLTSKILVQSPVTEVMASDEQTAKFKINSAVGKTVYHSPLGQPVVLEANQQVWALGKKFEILTTDGVPDELWTQHGKGGISGEGQQDYAKQIAKSGTLVADGHVSGTLTKADYQAGLDASEPGSSIKITGADQADETYVKAADSKWYYQGKLDETLALDSSLVATYMQAGQASDIYAPAPQAPAPQAPTPVDVSSWEKVGGQKGSNPAGFYQNPTDIAQWYIKTPKSELHATNEYAAALLYEAADVTIPEVNLAQKDGKTVIASKVVEGLTSSTPTDQAFKDKAYDGFAVDAWLANWDAVGLEYDNLVADSYGHPVRIDVGGSLLFRAMGTPKGSAFGKDATEIDTLRDGTNPQASKVYSDITDAEIKASIENHIAPLTPDQIFALVDKSGMAEPDRQKVKDLLVDRRAYLMDRFNVPEPAVVEPKSEVPQPPDSIAGVAVGTKVKIGASTFEKTSDSTWHHVSKDGKSGQAYADETITALWEPVSGQTGKQILTSPAKPALPTYDAVEFAKMPVGTQVKIVTKTGSGDVYTKTTDSWNPWKSGSFHTLIDSNALEAIQGASMYVDHIEVQPSTPTQTYSSMDLAKMPVGTQATITFKDGSSLTYDKKHDSVDPWLNVNLGVESFASSDWLALNAIGNKIVVTEPGFTSGAAPQSVPTPMTWPPHSETPQDGFYTSDKFQAMSTGTLASFHTNSGLSYSYKKIGPNKWSGTNSGEKGTNEDMASQSLQVDVMTSIQEPHPKGELISMLLGQPEGTHAKFISPTDGHANEWTKDGTWTNDFTASTATSAKMADTYHTWTATFTPPSTSAAKTPPTKPHPTTPAGTFTHPVSGEQVSGVLSVHQHKKSPNSYLVNTSGLGWVFFDKHGAKKNASTKTHLPYLETNYTQIQGDKATAPVLTSPLSKAAKAGKAGKANLPKTWTSPTGESYDLKPGMLVKNSGDAYVLIDSTGAHTYWSPQGTKQSLYSSKVSNYKSWATVAENKATALPAPDTTGLKALKSWTIPGAGDQPTMTMAKMGDPDQYALASMFHEQLKASLKTKKSWGYASTQPGSPFDSSDPLAVINHLASDDFQNMAKVAVLTLTEAQQKMSNKSYLGKEKSRWTFLAQIGGFSKKLKDSEYPAVDLENDLSQIQAKLSHHNVTFGADFAVPGDLSDRIQAVYDSKKFKETIKGLGFDPDSADHSTLTNYATNHDFAYAGGMSPEMAKIWVKADLGDPTVLKQAQALHPNGYYLHSMDDVKDWIKADAQFKITAANTTAYLKKTSSKLSKAQQTKQEKALKAKSAAVLKQVANMAPSYSNVIGSFITKFSDDLWSDGGGAGPKYTTAEVLDLVTSGGWTPSPKKPQDKINAFAKALGGTQLHGTAYDTGLDNAAVNSAIKGHGGNYVGKMDYETKLKWLRTYAVGDKAGVYDIESKAAHKGISATDHKDALTNPGSPGSPEGKAYRQALADFLEGQDWWQKIKGNPPVNAMHLTDEELLIAATALPLEEHAVAVGYAGYSSGSISKSTRRLILVDFIQSRGSLPKASWSLDDLALKKDDPDNPPAGVPQEAWALILGAEHDAPDVKDLTKDVTPETSMSLPNVNPLMQQNLPDLVHRLAQWASQTNGGDSQAAKATKLAIRKHLALRINEGKYTPGDQLFWTLPSGKAKIPVAPGTAIYKDQYDTFYVITGDHKQVASIKSNGAVAGISAANIENIETFTKVFQSPLSASWGQAQKDGLQVEKFTWDAVADYEDGKTKLPPEWAGKNEPTLLYTVKNSPGVPADLVTNVDKLPHDALVLAAWASSLPDQATLKVLTYKLKAGHYAQLQMKPLADPNVSYGAQILQGFTDAFSIHTQWPQQAKDDFIKDFGLPENLLKSDQEIQDKILALFSDTVDLETATTPSGLGLPSVLHLTHLDKSLGGMHSKTAWTDQLGNEWMSKSFPSDPNSAARIDAEHEANVIGRLFGFRNPETRTMKLDGTYSYVQHLAPATGSLSGVSPTDLNDEQLAQAMEEHVLDWLVSNHDTHPENLLKAPNGKSIIGIDKGQAFKFFPKDALAVDYLPPGNGSAVWYDQFYHLAQKGKIDKKRVDFVAKRVIGKALKIQESKDDEFRSHLELAFKNRTTWPSEYPTMEKFIDGLVARKHQIAQDFYDLYAKSVYGEYGAYSIDYTLDDLQPKQLYPGLHVQVSQELMDDVVKSAIHGKALMFNTTDLEDAHILLYTEQAMDGSTILAGEAKVRKNADKIIEKWLATQSVADDVQLGSSSMAVPSAPQNEILPGNEIFYSKVVTSAKTVNHHQADGEYNQSALEATAALQDYLVSVAEDLDTWEKAHPDKPYTVKSNIAQAVSKFTFVTKEQQDAWGTSIKKYIDDITKINEQKEAKAKVKPPIQIAAYKASKDLDTTSFIPGQGKVDETPTLEGWLKSSVPKYLPVGTIITATGVTDVAKDFTKTSDGSWVEKHYFEGDVGNPDQVMEQETTGHLESGLKKMITVNPEGYSLQVPGGGGPEFEHSAVVEVAPGKQIKVSKKKAYGTSGTLNQDTGTLKAHGKELHEGHTGYQYDIEYDGVKIMYRPWSSGAATSQQGYLRFTVTEGVQDPTKLDDILDTLKDMGLDLEAADEVSLEKFFWEHLYGVAMDRKVDAKTQQTINAIQQAYAGNPNMSNEEKLDVLRKAWALSIGQAKVDSADWSPHFDRTRPQDPNGTHGHPYWLRPDFSLADLKQNYGPNVQVSSITGKSQTDVALSGMMASTDDRLRLLGEFAQGMSSGADQSKGSAGFVFTRQNYGYGAQIYFHPRVALRTSNYAATSDTYGSLGSRKSSPFSINAYTKYAGGSNEMMVKHSIGVMGGVAAMVVNSGERTKILNHYHSYGISEIDGVPVEEIFVTSPSQAEQTVKKVWAHALEEESKLVGLTPSQKAAYAAYIGQGMSPAQALLEASNHD